MSHLNDSYSMTRRSLLVPATIAAALGCAGCEPPDVSVEVTPIRTTDSVEGAGPAVEYGDLVEVDYKIALPDGATLLQQVDYRFAAGKGTVIEGIDEAVIGMRAGGKKTFTCPPHKHWGSAGFGDGAVPAHTTLTIDLHVRSVEK